MTVFDSTLTSKGQTTIPAEIRERLSLKAGDKIRYVISGDKVYLRVKNKRAVDFAGILGPPPNGLSLTIEEMNDALGDALAEDDRRIQDDWNRHQHSLASDHHRQSETE
jgi:AbrB family looped-hinge helix DNA binding protein